MTADDSIGTSAADAVGGTDPASLPSVAEILGTVGLLAGQGATVGKEATTLMRESVRIALGRSDLAPDRKDRRFADPTWQQNPAYRRLMQSYLAGCRAVDNLVDNLDEKDWEHALTARFVADIATSAASPTNYFATNPAALKRAFETGGTSLLRGLGHWVDDVRHNGGLPSMAKKDQFTVGADLAVTPGVVIGRDDHAELIRYTPTTTEVFERPTLVVPPPIGRYYFLDLAPARSFVEYSTSCGIQTFMLSWRNPTAEMSRWDIDAYATRVIAAIDEVREATGQDQINVIGFCAGGILTTVALNALTARGEKPVANFSTAVTLIDFGGKNPINTFGYSPVLSLAGWNSRRKGVIDAQAMGSAFSWLRPNDLVWNYWVNNYLMGDEPPAFDVLAWNADGTALPAALHAQFLDIFRNNPLPEPGQRTYLDTPYDLGSIDVPAFVIGAVNDHLTPWRGTYRTTQLIGSDDVTYTLSNAGHIASLVNPPGNPKASYFVRDQSGDVDADDWLADAEKRTGSWWEHWAEWTTTGRSGDQIPAPADTGPGLGDAPGLYVRDKAA